MTHLQLLIRALGILAVMPFSAFGRYVIFIRDSVVSLKYSMINWKLTLRQLEFVGNKSFMIIVLSGIMVGAVFGFQLGEIFRIFGAESLLGAAAGYALSRELAPVVGAFLVTGRAGSSMAAEIGSMRVNEQIDAMRAMAVNPHNYLVLPRIVASIIMMPLLSGIFVLSGVVASYFVGVAVYNIDTSVFLSKITWIISTGDIRQGLEKATIFGFIYSSIGCFKGFNATGGAKGVGKATTQAVVYSLVTILIADFVISYFQWLMD